MSRVGVVLVNWNSGSLLSSAVRAIDPGEVCEIVVVDNRSTDGSLEPLDAYAAVRIVRNTGNAGFAAGVNRGFVETGSRYVLVLNPDVTARPGAIGTLEAFMDAHPRAGAAGGHLSGRYGARPLPTRRSLVRENLGIGVRGAPADGQAPFRVEQPAASALMIRREAFDAVGGFDEQFHPAWYEDVDFARSLAQRGWEAWVVPAARFGHEGGYSSEVLGPERFMEAYYTNQFRYARKHLGPGSVFWLKAALCGGTLARSIARPHRFSSYLRGLVRVMAA